MRDGPVPADPGRDEPRPDWEPVITCPDPMTAEEWQTQLECEPVEGTDPEEYPDEEDYLSPEALNLTDAELAEIAEATRFAALGAGQATGPDDSYAGASDDELIGALCAWDRSESHAHARKLAAITELRRRRPVIELLASGRGAGVRDEDYLADEIAHGLAESRRAADGLAAVAGALDGKLPGTRAALLDGVITPVKARIIATATAPLDQDEARAAEEQVLGRAGRITPGSLREAIRRAGMNVAPAKAKERRGGAGRAARGGEGGGGRRGAAPARRGAPPAAGGPGRGRGTP